MSSRRRAEIDRNATFDEDDTPALTMKDADAALYGALARVDGKRKAVERTRFGAFKISPKGLEIGDGAQQKDWEEAGQFIFQVESGIQWLIGDWLVYGENLQWGDVKRFSDETQRNYQTLRDYMVVSRAVPLSLRNYNLSYNHYRAVTSIPEAEREAALAYATEHELSVAAFRKLLHPESHTPSLSATSNVDASYKAMRKLEQRDLESLKSQELEAAHSHLLELRRWIDVMENRLKARGDA